ncbi:MAG: radical SAM protein [Candidatus Eremiobacteraeota bacterium]|nr:radical SAM protein [Candidatus Eremiobacteraeota bacterium]
MKVLLIFPPQAQPFLPHLALPSLAAVLKKAGADVVQRDYNLESYEYFLSPEQLVKAGVSEFIANQIDDVKKSLRTGNDYFLSSDYYGAISVLQEYLKYISRGYRGVDLTLKDYTTRYSNSKMEDILKAVNDKNGNLYIEFFEKKMQEIQDIKPDVVGISVAWLSQLIPGFTLSNMIKKRFPDIHITMGGSMIGHLSHYLKYKRKMFSLVDSFLPYEADGSFIQLVRTLEKGGNLSEVPGLIYLQKKKVKSSKPEIPGDLNALPTPDFDGLMLDKYYSPQVYLPISASRGCYWSKCKFCTHHLSGSHFRQKKAEKVFKEMNDLNERYGCKDFYFVDDAFPPETARKLAIMIANDNKPYRWVAEFRAEKIMDREYFDTLYRGGCRLVLFGLESYCQRILDRMDKGWKRETAAEVIRNCSDAGIKTWVFFFLGFPGERRYEAKQTLKFIINNRQYIDMVAGGRFVLTRDSMVHKNPEEFSIDKYQDENEEDLQITYPYWVREGINEEDVEELLELFRRDSRVQKFLEPFVAEPHLLYLRKSCFTKKETK